MQSRTLATSTPKKCAEKLVQLVQEQSLSIPSTFPQFHSGGSYTCMSKNKPHRIDYVIVPNSWLTLDISTHVDYEFEMRNTKEDHHPVVLEMLCDLRVTSSYVPKSGQYDRKNAALEYRDQVANILTEMPKIPWDIPIDDHVAMIDDFCLRRLQQLFPLPRRPVKQPYFDVLDLQLIDDKKELAASLRQAKEVCRHHEIKILFMAWKGKVTEHEFLERHQAQMHLALVQEQYGKKVEVFRKIRLQRRKTFLQGIVDEFNASFENRDPKRLYAALRPLRPQSQKQRIRMPMPLPGLTSQEGEEFDSNAAIAAEWERAWRELELAVPCDPKAMRPPL